MSAAPLKLARPAVPRHSQRLMDMPVRRPPPAGAARRRITVRLAKRLLPVVALALLSLVALWPELAPDEHRRFTYRAGSLVPESGQLTDLRYNGVDDRDRPYTMTASAAKQVSPERINLVDPKGDINLESGSWMMVQALQGVYGQRSGQLDLSGDVVLYRDDGLTLLTDAATLDMRAGVATSAERVHAEGPFGTIDAQGFAVTDRGTVVRFTGPGRLVLNARSR
jgi:lipopolysaccharide export system protein LptC